MTDNYSSLPHPVEEKLKLAPTQRSGARSNAKKERNIDTHDQGRDHLSLNASITSPRTHRPTQLPRRLPRRCPSHPRHLDYPAARSSLGGALAARRLPSPSSSILHHAFAAWTKPSQCTAPLQLGSTITFLIKVVQHRIYGWAATPASPPHSRQTCCHPVKYDYSQVSFKRYLNYTSLCLAIRSTICVNLYELRVQLYMQFTCLPQFLVDPIFNCRRCIL
jgi:hypothetical protein